MIRLVRLLLLVFLIGVQVGFPSLQLGPECGECHDCCSAEGACDAACLGCSTCFGPAHPGVLPSGPVPALMPAASALPREGSNPQPPRATEIPHVLRPALV